MKASSDDPSTQRGGVVLLDEAANGSGASSSRKASRSRASGGRRVCSVTARTCQVPASRSSAETMGPSQRAPASAGTPGSSSMACAALQRRNAAPSPSASKVR